MRKKIFAMLLALALIPTVLSGCSGTQNASGNDRIVLKYWTLFGGGDAKYMKEIVDKWNRTHDDVYVDYIQFDWDDYYTKLVTGIAAGKSPDIAVSHITMLPQLVKLGIVSQMDSVANKVGVKWDTFNQNILKSTLFNGHHYSIPIDTHPFILFYNKKYLKQAGLLNEDGKPKMKNSAQGFVNFLLKLKKRLPKGVAPWSLSTTGSDPYRLWWALYYQLGADGVVGKDGHSVDIEMDKAIKAANYVKNMFYKYKVIPLNLANFYGTFQSKKAAITTTGVWATGVWESTKGLKFGAMPFPTLYKKDAAWGDSHNLILPKHDKVSKRRRKAAMKFAYFVAKNGQIWAKAGHIPAKVTNFKEKAYKKLPHRSQYKEAGYEVAFPRQSVFTWPIRAILQRNLDEIWTDRTSPEKAFKNVKKEMKQLFKNSLLTDK